MEIKNNNRVRLYHIDDDEIKHLQNKKIIDAINSLSDRIDEIIRNKVAIDTGIPRQIVVASSGGGGTSTNQQDDNNPPQDTGCKLLKCLNDVVIPNEPSDGQVLFFKEVETNKHRWTNVLAELNILDDVNITSPADGEALVYDGATNKWVNKNAGGSLADLSDTDITSPSDKDVLQYNSSTNKWENGVLKVDSINKTGDPAILNIFQDATTEPRVRLWGHAEYVDIYSQEASGLLFAPKNPSTGRLKFDKFKVVQFGFEDSKDDGTSLTSIYGFAKTLLSIGGSNTFEWSDSAGIGNNIAFKFTAPEDGAIGGIKLYIKKDSSARDPIRAYLYSHDSTNDEPASLLTGGIWKVPADSMTTGGSWVIFNMEYPVTAGTTYWIGFYKETHDDIYYIFGDNTTGTFKDRWYFSGSWTDRSPFTPALQIYYKQKNLAKYSMTNGRGYQFWQDTGSVMEGRIQSGIGISLESIYDGTMFYMIGNGLNTAIQYYQKYSGNFLFMYNYGGGIIAHDFRLAHKDNPWYLIDIELNNSTYKQTGKIFYINDPYGLTTGDIINYIRSGAHKFKLQADGQLYQYENIRLAQGKRFYLSQSDATYLTYDGTNIKLVKAGTTVATW